MGRVSKIKMREVDRKIVVGRFYRALASLKKPAEVGEFLREFLTHTEVDMLAKRLEVLKRVSEGKLYHEIRTLLQVNDATIGRLRNRLHRSTKKFKRILEELKEAD